MNPVIALLATALVALAGPALAWGQTLTPTQRQQLDEGVGDRVGALTVLASDQSAAGGLYGWRGNEERVDVTKFTWYVEFNEDDPLPLGDTGIRWSAVYQGAMGYVEVNTEFPNTFLAGNHSTTKSLILGMGGGARFYLTEDFSVLPTFQLIYSYTRERFDSKNANGDLVQSASGGEFVDWDVNQLTYSPQAEIRFRHRWGDWRLTVSSVYSYYQGQPVGSVPDVSAFESESNVWLNKADLEWWTPLFISHYQVRTGVFFQRQDLYGGVVNALLTDFVYAVGMRVVLDVQGYLPLCEYIGLGATYFWSNVFQGTSWGIEVSILF
jgi:hypothetical protein